MNKQFSPAGIATGAEALTAGLSPAALAYAEAQRGISRATLEKLGVVSGMAFFPSLERKSDAVRFPYRAAGEVVNVKSAAFPDKAFAMIKGGKLAFFNLEPVLASQAEAVYLTEGEWDAAALVEAGVPVDQVLSVPNGARERKGSGGYDFVDEALKAGLGRKKRFVWCGDMDGPGLALRHDMARILGTAKFWFADWPTGCKDANDCLLAHGARIVREIVRDGAHPWPADGLFRLSEMPEPPPLDPWHPGFPEWEDKVLLAPRTLSVFTGQPGHGKALALNTPIPTPAGWTTMGELRPGDRVFDECGEPCAVTLATPVMLGHPCFRVTFDDGSEIIADADHLWLTETEGARQGERAWINRGARRIVLPRGTDQSHKRVRPSVVTTAEIARTLVCANGKKNHAVRLALPIACEPANLPIPPYTLGAWLGDGTATAAAITCAVRDRAVLEHVEADGVPVRRREHKSRAPTWALSDGVKNSRKECVQRALRELGVLGNKHIPPAYLRASFEQRLALLQGLMDTDGHIAADRQCEFCTTTKALADGVYELVCSLGIRARILLGRATLRGVDCGQKYRVMFATNFPVFRLERKAARIGGAPLRRKYRYIVACDPVPSVPVRCIQVDSPSRLYLAGRSFIPTHNTSLAMQIWFQICRQYGVSAFVTSFETRAKPHHRRALRTLFTGKLEKHQSEAEIKQADAFIERHFLWGVHPQGRPTLDWWLDLAEIAVVRHGARIVQLDPWNRLEAARARDESETEYIGRCLRTVHAFAQDFNCHVQLLAHPAKLHGDKRGRIPELEDISGSKNWDNMVDQGFVIHRPEVFGEGGRKTAAKFYCKKSRFSDELGYPCVLNMNYNLQLGRYESTDYANGAGFKEH